MYHFTLHFLIHQTLDQLNDCCFLSKLSLNMKTWWLAGFLCKNTLERKYTTLVFWPKYTAFCSYHSIWSMNLFFTYLKQSTIPLYLSSLGMNFWASWICRRILTLSRGATTVWESRNWSLIQLKYLLLFTARIDLPLEGKWMTSRSMYVCDDRFC